MVRHAARASRSRDVVNEPDMLELRAILRVAGLRCTSPRLAVLQHVHRHRRATTHAEVHRALRSRGFGFDRATVYRVLIDLVEVGVLSRIDLGDHAWRFELVADGGREDEHPHFVCVSCGDVLCLPGVAVRLAQVASAPKAVAKRQVGVQLRGRCDRCA